MNATSLGQAAPVRRSRYWSILPSVLMIAAGLLAVVIPKVAGLRVTLLVGGLLLTSGLMHFVYAWHTGVPCAIVWETLLGITDKFAGGYVLFHRLPGMAGPTLALAIYLFAQSILEFILGFQLRPRRGSGWLFADSVITLILAAMVWRAWPSSTAWALGTLVGVSMLFSGIGRLMFSLARNFAAEARAA